MKNKYLFKGLNEKELPENADEAAVFFEMRKLSTEAIHVKTLDSIKDVEHWLSAEWYYVANNLVAHKGKTLIFKGRVVLAERSNLVVFLHTAIADEDLRPLLISPCFKKDVRQVIFISEDECHLYLADAL
ncbi:hypothetical protein [Pseudomonas lutea]|jgi:hypothetical protein|uniref:Uncharacterized protein n=1 Tax=Pseudomonas lutea TaxID=243924 RepID=A0A9X0EF93_9PSED|nr:hypothetical protein [Pseudomonas lutea]KGF64704.1 hypothetical protein LT42_01590 [Pseudomonas lutea]